MLRSLSIRNLAVIEAVDVEFEPGFNVLTGETGAGKSIVVEAVGLLLGGRASADLVRTGESRATIEAVFHAAGTDTVVRRELSSQGRSRSFVNGAPATASALRELSAHLVELHGQHEHQALLDPLTHLPVVDEYGELTEIASQVSQAWTRVRALREQLDRSRMGATEKAARLELIEFHLGEIERAAPQPSEDTGLTSVRDVLSSAERVQALCEESYAALHDSDGSILASLSGVWKRVGELSTFDPQFSPYVDARDDIKAQLEDLALALRRYADGIDASPGRLQEVEDRLALLERLKRKHGPTLQNVLERATALAHERDLLAGTGEQTSDLQRALDLAESHYLSLASELSVRRRDVAEPFARKLEALLAELAMARTRFEVRFRDLSSDLDGWTDRGIDHVEFYLSPNPGEELRPVARVASGGELSRVMLALRTLTIGNAPDKTLIFDEVDAGIGGRVAEVVGRRLEALGQRFQVLCVTHLPQIAARGASHYRIDKHTDEKRTTTSVARLDATERVDEIARMIGGAAVTAALRTTAQELLDAGRDGKPERGTRKGAKGESQKKAKAKVPRPTIARKP
ncbi:MAG: DNA repair protein RecN [Acidobacteria bacterium]|nr:DNA repair protein RecN [Acidobacteriota bacterium]